MIGFGQFILTLIIVGALIIWAVSYSKRKRNKKAPFEKQKELEKHLQPRDAANEKDKQLDTQKNIHPKIEPVRKTENNHTFGTIAGDDNKTSIYGVLEKLSVHRIADEASSYDDLCHGIDVHMSLFLEKTDLVIDMSYSITALSAEKIAWHFMLLNPSHPVINRLDHKNKKIVRTIQTMNPKDYVKWHHYNRDAVVEKLGCTVAIGNHITEYWRVLDMNYDPAANTIDLSHVFFDLHHSADEAAKLYNIYCACGEKAAQNKVQDYLVSNYPKIRALYSDGTMDLEKNQVVMKLKFPREHTKQYWTKIPHLFFQSNTRDPQRSAEQFYDCLMDYFSPHFGLSTAYLFEDGHNEYFCYSIGTAKGSETEKELKFDFFEKYSQHDGGGYYSKALKLYKLSEEEWEKLDIPSELQQSKETIPCRGYWVKDKRKYYAEPFGMERTYLTF